MGRHTQDEPATGGRARPIALSVTGVLVAVAFGLGWALSDGPGSAPAEAGPAPCDETVRLTVAPELDGSVRELLDMPVPLPDGGCADVSVTAEQPLQTTASLASLAGPQLPHLWLPDSSLWVARAATAGAQVEPVASVASSPVVVATSRAAVDGLGWSSAPPSWGESLTNGRPVAVPDLAASAEGLAALSAVKASLGGGDEGENAVVAAALAAARGEAPSPEAALEAASQDAADAPLLPLSEQEVFAANRGQEAPALVAVYPSDGSPSLDYPLVRVPTATSASDEAVQAVVDSLTSDDAAAEVRRAGFRDAAGAAPTGAGDTSGVQEAAPETLTLAPEEVQSLLQRLASLAKPSWVLTALDVSRSMEAATGEGQSRIELARDASKSALALFPSDAAVGLWTFASQLTPETDWEEVVPVRGLTEDAGGVPQQQALVGALDTMPGRLTGGGTSLYDTTLGAVRAARESYDEERVSSVVLITDGQNEDSAGIQLDELLETLRAEIDPERPVQVVAVGLGPEADVAALQQIADAAGGNAYSAADPRDLQAVLFDALRRRG